MVIGAALVGVGSGLLSPVFLVFFTEQVAESVRGRVFGLFNALGLIASPLGLGAIALALSVTTVENAAMALLAAWVVVMAYALVSKGMRTFAAASVADPAVIADPAPAKSRTGDLAEDRSSRRHGGE